MTQPLRPASLVPIWTALRRRIAINSLYDVDNFGDHKRAPKFGLCVSGGPDSMALAYLLSNMLKQLPDDSSQLHAFIVDHRARPGSRSEAQRVATWMRELDIPSTIVPIKWDVPDPLSLPNFESVARKHRYRALASFSSVHGVKHLLTGHHMDDQVETVLMRLLRAENPSLLALRGMQSTSRLPECETTRGVRNAEPPIPLDQLFSHDTSLSSWQYPTMIRVLRESRLGMTFETLGGKIQGLMHGGMELHRPLLSFRKDSLVATCNANGVPYVEDKTNLDPSFTRRNAIRALRTKHILPRALQDDSILSLSRTACDTLDKISQQASEALRSISILAFDFRSGTVDLRVPVSLQSLIGKDNNVAACIISKLSSLVSAKPADEQDTLAPGSIVSLFWRWLHDPFWSDSGDATAPKFTYQNTVFEGIKPPKQMAATSTIWRLSRAPLTQREKLRTSINFKSQPDSQFRRGDLRSRWELWDHRYWFRIGVGMKRGELRRPEARELLGLIGIRSYALEDGAILRSRMSKEEWVLLSKMLRDAAPGKIRWTLPVLTCNDEVVAFPTLSCFLVSPGGFSAQTNAAGFGKSATLRWSIAYKLLPKNISQWGSSVSLTFAVPPVMQQLEDSADDFIDLG